MNNMFKSVTTAAVAACISLGCISTALAVTNKSPRKNVTTKVVAPKPNPAIMVNLYSSPSLKAKVIAKNTVSQPWVEIKRLPSGHWVKVGNRITGQTGWINRKEYLKAMRAYRTPQFQTIIVSSDQDAHGKQTKTVVAFRNGKQLSAAQARKLYDELRIREMRQRQAFNRFDRDMGRFDQQLFRQERAMVNRLNQFSPQFHFRQYGPNNQQRPLFQERTEDRG